jgi:hypothetical protein
MNTFYIKAKAHVPKQIPSWVTTDTMTLFHEIPRTKQVFLLAMHDLKYANAAEVCFSILQSYEQGLLCCLIIFTPMVSHEIFQGPNQTSGSPRGPSPDCREGGESSPTELFNFPWNQMCSARPCIIVLKTDSSFHPVLVMKCMWKFLENLNIANCTDNVLCGCGSIVVKALCCKPEGCGFKSRWGGFFKLT